MRKIAVLIFVITVTAIGSISAQGLTREYLDVGDTINVYPKVEWIKGNATGKFDSSKVYIVDLWATWCKPCKAAMPVPDHCCPSPGCYCIMLPFVHYRSGKEKKSIYQRTGQPPAVILSAGAHSFQ